MEILGIIPARYASSRFPGKPLADISGKSMIRRVYEQCLKAEVLAEVIIATDDHRIADHVKAFGGQVVMTSEEHQSGTERCVEALLARTSETGKKWDAVINIQGDEPFISPNQINQVGMLLNESEVAIATLVRKISGEKELNDPNVVKAVLNKKGEAMYFSRLPIPYMRDKRSEEQPQQVSYFKHVGIYGYRSNVLVILPGLLPTEPEKAESLEQLRWLGYGLRIMTGITDEDTLSIDTPSDLLKITNIT